MLFPGLGRSVSRKTLPEVLNVRNEPLRRPPAREITSIYYYISNIPALMEYSSSRESCNIPDADTPFAENANEEVLTHQTKEAYIGGNIVSLFLKKSRKEDVVIG